LGNHAVGFPLDGFDARISNRQVVIQLRSKQLSSPEIEASAVVPVDVLIMALTLPMDVDEDRVSAISAAVVSISLAN